MVPRGCATLCDTPSRGATRGLVVGTSGTTLSTTRCVGTRGPFPSVGINVTSELGDNVMGAIFCGFVMSTSGFCTASGYVTYKGYMEDYILGGVRLGGNGPI